LTFEKFFHQFQRLETSQNVYTLLSVSIEIERNFKNLFLTLVSSLFFVFFNHTTNLLIFSDILKIICYFLFFTCFLPLLFEGRNINHLCFKIKILKHFLLISHLLADSTDNFIFIKL